MAYDYDYLVIGSGPGGHVSAIRAAQLGMKVAVIEKDPAMFGGVCLNEGCIPAKSLYHSAQIFGSISDNADLCGIAPSAVKADMGKMVAKSREAAETLRKGLLFLFKKNNIDLIEGEAVFSGKDNVIISSKDGEKEIASKNILIATGSSPKDIPSMPFDGEKIISSSEAIHLTDVPGNILIVGAGAIGVELASFFNLLGTDVTIVEAESSVLPLEDKEISRGMQTVLKKKGITVKVSSLLEGVSLAGDVVKAAIKSGDKTEEVEFEKVIIAIGRKPTTADLNLEKVGVAVDENGYIAVDDTMSTGTKGIFAAGDVTASPMLAHVASKEGEIAAETAAGKKTEPMGLIPNVVYSDVSVSSIGLTEEAAKDSGAEVKSGKQFFKANGRAVAYGRTEGFIKVVADASSGKLLGAHILGYAASEMIHEFVIAIRAGFTVDEIADTVHAHPTFSETAIDACRSVFGKPLQG